MESNLKTCFFRLAIGNTLAGEVAGKGAIRFTAFEQLGIPTHMGDLRVTGPQKEPPYQGFFWLITIIPPNSPLIRPAISWGGLALEGVGPLDSHDENVDVIGSFSFI